MSSSPPIVDHMDARKVLTKADKAHVRAFWMDIRGPITIPGITGRTDPFETVPELAPSLESLIQQGYGHDDIANMFGLSPGCIATWLTKLKLKSQHRHAKGRRWSAQLEKFVPVPVCDAPSYAVSDALRKAGIRSAPNRRALRRDKPCEHHGAPRDYKRRCIECKRELENQAHKRAAFAIKLVQKLSGRDVWEHMKVAPPEAVT